MTTWLLKLKMNDVLLRIKTVKLRAEEFRFEEQKEMTSPDFGPSTTDLYHRVIHKPSGYYLEFDDFLVRYTPGETRLHEDKRCTNWQGQLQAVDHWLRNLVREVETPDLWAGLSQEAELLGPEPAEAENTPYTADEQVQIEKAIEEIRIYLISMHSLGPEPLATVNRKLDLFDCGINQTRPHRLEEYLCRVSRRFGLTTINSHWSRHWAICSRWPVTCSAMSSADLPLLLFSIEWVLMPFPTFDMLNTLIKN